MSARSPSPFAWHKPTGPAVGTGLFTLIMIAPMTFILLFGVLPPFWGGASRGIWIETSYAWNITADVGRNGIISAIRHVVPLIPTAWSTGDWIAPLREQGSWAEFLIRIFAVVIATLWVTVLTAMRTYRRTGRIQGFEYVAGPQLFEGWQATSLANRAMARDGKITKDALYLAYNLALSTSREVLSFAYIGGQGSGKTTALKFLLRQLIGRKKTRIILLDQKGDLTAEWPASDVILFAPHDQRSHAWDIGADVTGEIAAQEFAATLVSTEGPETVWPQGARQIIEAVVIALQRRHGTSWGFTELLEALQSSPVGLRSIVEPVRPDVLTFLGIDVTGEFTRTSIGYITNLQTAALPLLRPLALAWEHVPKAERVSLRAWLHGKGPAAQTLLLQNNTDFPEISAGWMRQVIQRLVRISGSSSFPDNPERRIWFILDEFPQLGHMPDLLRVPETHRSKGATLVLTAQSISQVYSTYGRDDGDTLVNLMQTKIILKPGQGSDLVSRLNAWLGKLRWRDPMESGVTEAGIRIPIREHEDDLLTPAYMNGLGPETDGVSGVILGLGPDVFRVHWPYQTWPKQRPGVRLAPWAHT